MTTNPADPGVESPGPLPTPDPDEVEPEMPGVDPDWPQTPQRNEPVERVRGPA
jgi:hypothetical protein